ncbi:9960_t:CDS:1 [Acaulospora colombiana]|uniref:9960_t:CDS:1 n=1 Tax=Acaulospora colombiana TaxID=27376 RepID=A0ACA9LBG9_9GLOM|nr:9960_t:CDS:1 [Acaulospora colombiana]
MKPNYKGKKKSKELSSEDRDELPHMSLSNMMTDTDIGRDTPDSFACGSNNQCLFDRKKQLEKEMNRCELEHDMICVWGENKDPHVSTHVTGCNNFVTKILLGSLANRRPHHVRFTDTLIELESILGEDDGDNDTHEPPANLVASIHPKLDASIDQLDALFGVDGNTGIQTGTGISACYNDFDEEFSGEESNNEDTSNIDLKNESPHFKFFVIPDNVLELEEDFMLPKEYLVGKRPAIDTSKFTFFRIPEELCNAKLEFTLPKEYLLKFRRQRFTSRNRNASSSNTTNTNLSKIIKSDSFKKVQTRIRSSGIRYKPKFRSQ